MLIACPNCGTSYGVEMATLRPPRGWTRQVRCHRCHCVWQAELSHADKLVVAANAVAPPPNTRDVVVRFVDRDESL